MKNVHCSYVLNRILFSNYLYSEISFVISDTNTIFVSIIEKIVLIFVILGNFHAAVSTINW